jgi:SAM-dependent methyltransferase
LISFRRKLLDERLAAWTPGLNGPTLDLGGKKHGRRGAFTPPEHLRKTWRFANLDLANAPDCRCKAESLPFKPASFESVVMTEVLEYLADPKAGVREIHRVLRPGGTALLSIPFMVSNHFDRDFDLTRFSEAGLRTLVAGTGLEIQALEPMGSAAVVIHDMLAVSCGYASADRTSLPNRVLGRLLRMMIPFTLRLDGALVSQKSFLTTGYFLVLRKGRSAIRSGNGNTKAA